MKWVLLAILLLVTGALRFSTPHFRFGQGGDEVLALGFIILFSFLIGKFAKRLSLPMITGYLIAGILAGPEIGSLFSHSSVEKLHLIDRIALGIIALTAGGELRLSALREQAKSISFVVIFQVIVVLLGVFGGVYFLSGALGLSHAYDTREVAVIAMLLATVSVANSPATTIAVVTETQSAGPLTDRAIGITIVKDVLILVLFTVVMAFSQLILAYQSSALAGDLIQLSLEMVMSIVTGVLLGVGIVAFLKYVRQDTAIFVLGVAFFASFLSEMFHLEVVMVCVMAGFVVENFSEFGDDFIRSIEESSLPVYVVFFSIAGASLDLEILREFWLIASVLVVMRIAMTYIGTLFGSKKANDEPVVQTYLWTGFVGQAGISLGLGIIIADVFSNSFGPFLQTVIVAVIVLNQIVGPVVFRIGLAKSGEIGQKFAKPLSEM